MANVNGVEIDLMPNEGMRKEAQRYRDWKADGEGGGTDVARTRASQILSGNELSADTVITMSAWFARDTRWTSRARGLALVRRVIQVMVGWLGLHGAEIRASLGLMLGQNELKLQRIVPCQSTIMTKKY